MTPSWISGLTDPALKADFTSFYDAGSITEAQLAKAFADLAAENAKSGSTLSASQFADLQSIAINISSMGASSYLQFITNALVDGDPANATWTGGAAKSVPLGDLGVGSTPTQLSELVDKWFYGSDLPKDRVSLPPEKPFTIKYSTVDKPLFGSDGPTMSDIQQGALGDCYLLASLAEVAKQNPSAISSMITDNGNGTYGVRFYVDGESRYVTVNNQLADGGTDFNSATQHIWASVVETAFAEVQQQGLIDGDKGYDYGNSFSTIGNGGDPAFALEAITNATEITRFHATGSTWKEQVLDQSLSVTSETAHVSGASVASILAADLLVGDDVDLVSETGAKNATGLSTLIGDHVMSIYGYDASTGMLEIRNPWGAWAPGDETKYDTFFQESLKTLLSDGDYIVADNVGSATSVAGASVVAASGLQDMAQITSFSVKDSVANIDDGLPQLILQDKLTSITAVGTAGADTLNLTGLSAAATIDMGGDADSATLNGHALNLGSNFDSVTLGLGDASLDFSFKGGGVEYVANFSSSHDQLSISLGGAGSLKQTLINGGDWISSSSDGSHGVFLADVTSLQRFSVSHEMATVV
jgi:Calpain family cysteine protease